MGLKFTKGYVVSFDQVNALGEMTLKALFDRLMMTSGFQERSLPGLQAFRDQNQLAWVVTAHQLEINRLPRYGEEIAIETEALTYNAFFTYRQFKVYDQTGQILVTALSTFSMIDLKDRKVVRVPDDIIQAYQVAPAKRKVKRLRLAKDLTANDQVDQVTAQFLDIDGNRHVNNGVYLNWVTNSLGADWWLNKQLTHLSIAYEREIALGSQVDVLTYDQMDESHQTYHEIKSNQGRHALVALTWQDRAGHLE
ncbi:hypothetical protein AWM75_07300 [Aerococcus urinaehominis]|uniref:Uncharacterized protein n=1 Tax=Aerococcus urinaehominis TaxID=128944 RepID=A0A0X8FM15_9LACT|nr:acyl-ACP thioesterase domain-containing protein [Aerococcus urinaehominis]AMB99779.1 hypothetical protein AWM75_07300 [Aerococcus urinaehominis]SDM09288.1 medium-chain acyl-[acyl-carrier-protein] hydrolase [Aerococcus urinaehominis]